MIWFLKKFYVLLDSNYSDYPPFYAIDIPTVSNNKIPLALNCGGTENIDDAHRENPGKNEIIFQQFTKNIIPTTDDAIEKSNLINNYYCFFLKVIKTAKNQPNFVCEITQRERATSYCCGFIGCIIAYVLYYYENSTQQQHNLDYICRNGLEFYKKIAWLINFDKTQKLFVNLACQSNICRTIKWKQNI